MCTLAAESSWLMVDSWEAFQSYQVDVLDHSDYKTNTVLGSVSGLDGERCNV